jgi:hypothetical protein
MRAEVVDSEPSIGYLQTVTSNVPTFVSIMMMPLCKQEAGPFGM